MKTKTQSLNEALADEHKAPGEYHRLARKLDLKKDRKIIRGIIKQERKHFKLIRKIKRREKKIK